MGPIQSSINTALGVAALASGITNKKQVDKAQDKLDKKEGELAKKEGELANTKKEKNKIEKENKQLKDEDIKSNMYLGGNTYNASNDLPTAKETNVDTAGDNSVNDIKGPSPSEFINVVKNKQQNVDPYAVEQIMGFHALKMLDSRIAAKRAIIERNKRAMKIDPRTKRARENGGNK